MTLFHREKLLIKKLLKKVPQDSVRGPVLFNIFNMDDEVRCSFRKNIGYRKLGGMTDSPEGRAALQRDLDKLERWTDKKLRKFNKEKHRECTWGGALIHCQAAVYDGAAQLESSPAEKDQECLVKTRLMK